MHRIVEPTRLPALAFISSQLAPKSMASWRSISLNQFERKGSLEFSSRLKNFLQKIEDLREFCLFTWPLLTSGLGNGSLQPIQQWRKPILGWHHPPKLMVHKMSILTWPGVTWCISCHHHKCQVKTNTDRSSIFVLHLMWPRRTLRTLRNGKAVSFQTCST